MRDLGCPAVPGSAALFLLTRHEQCEFRKPADVSHAEFVESLLAFAVIAEESLRCFFQQRRLPRNDDTELDVVLGKCRFVSKVRGLQNPLFTQFLEADQEMISRVRRKRLERGVAIACRVQRQHLPQLLTSIPQKINEGECLRSKFPDAMRPRQAGGMKQDSAGARKFHTGMRSKNIAYSGSTA